MRRLFQLRPRQRQDWILIGCLIIVAVVLFAMVDAYLFNWNYSGFGPKTLWDWMELLIVPSVLAIGGYIYNRTEKQAERDQAERRNQAEREIAEDNQREAALQTYLDRMSELLLADKGLRNSEDEAEIRSVARSRTLTVLRRLDPVRKGSVVQFLYESDLITKDKIIVDIEGADLIRANLVVANLADANLAGANLAGANLLGAYLQDANLAGVKLEGANLKQAYLDGVNLIGAKLKRADLSEVSLENADLRRAYLEGADLSGANLAGANLEDANLRHAYLIETNLEGVSFKGANLTEAHLNGSPLLRANFNGANLNGTYLNGVDLIGAIGITQEQLASAITDVDTILPE